MPSKPLYSAGESLRGLPTRLDKTHEQECIFQAVKKLPERYADLLMLYVYGENGQKLTLTEIGNRLGVGDERVRQLRKRAYKLLQKNDKVQLIQENRGSKLGLTPLDLLCLAETTSA